LVGVIEFVHCQINNIYRTKPEEEYSSYKPFPLENREHVGITEIEETPVFFHNWGNEKRDFQTFL